MPLPADTTWYEHKYEYSYVEVWVLVALVGLALLVDVASHGLSRRADAAYCYGEVAETPVAGRAAARRRGHRGHARLAAELQRRAGGKLATLGFLAFLTFVFDSVGGFKWLAGACQSGEINMPRTSEEWLRVVEVVYMQLFIGMLLYFLLVGLVVAGSVERLRLWEAMRRGGEMAPPPRTICRLLAAGTTQRDRAAFLLWRCHFLAELPSAWRARPAALRAALRTLGATEATPGVLRLLHDEVESSTFSAYLAESVESGVEDFLVVHAWTWLLLLLLLCVFAACHRLVRWPLLDLVPCLVGLTALLVGAMWAVTKLHRRRIVHACCCVEGGSLSKQGGALSDDLVRLALSAPGTLAPGDVGKEDGSADVGIPAGSYPSVSTASSRLASLMSWRKRLSANPGTELMLRSLQTVLLITSYAFVGTLLSSDGWVDQPIIVGVDVFLFAALFLLLAMVLPSQVPLFLAIRALPPFAEGESISGAVARLVPQRGAGHSAVCTDSGTEAATEEGEDRLGRLLGRSRLMHQRGDKPVGYCEAAAPLQSPADAGVPRAKQDCGRGRAGEGAEGRARHPFRLGRGVCREARPDGGAKRRTLERWLRAVYTRCDPDKRHQIKRVIATHEGREEELVRNVAKRYEVSPPRWVTAPQPSTASGRDAESKPSSGGCWTAGRAKRPASGAGMLCVGCGRWAPSSGEHRCQHRPQAAAPGPAGGRGVWL